MLLINTCVFSAIDNINIFQNFFAETCQNSCFGNIETNPSYIRITCSGNENSLYECGRTTRKNGCGHAAGIYCGK